MIARRGLAFVIACCAILLAAPLGAATRVRQALLTAPDAQGARLVLELSAAPGKPKVFTMRGPDRVVIDLPRTSADGLKLPKPAGPVKAIREGVQPDGTLRIVMDLARPLDFRSRVEGQKLIVELGRPGPATDAAPSQPRPVRAEHAPADVGRDIIVAIDPGHGGQDPGAIGKGGTREKDVVLAISRELARRIDAEPGMRAFMTRTDDRFIKLRDRIALARKAGADMFISVHADAVNKSDVTGSSVYVLSLTGASSEAARWLAEQENAADLKGGVSLSDKDDALASVLMDVSLKANIAVSGAAAEYVLAQLDRVGTIRKTKVQNAAFVVLKSPDIPSILVETAFISNPGEEKKLRTPAHQQAIAQAIFTGVREYFRQHPPDGTLYARERARRGGGGELVAAREAP
ncbi:MAG: N-acetylmuramoyl-L-alanine amidase [Pseudomonadota bacterium]|jgi:N-acetylmuramoyl-L-alanine amidase|nr:MAG: N-acetylmuramoyl-L-alanine amidase [Pseudomonadota bacterium]